MQIHRLLAACLLAVLALSWSTTIAHSSSVNHVVHDGVVSVELSLDFFQNMTAVPNLNKVLTGPAAQNLTSAIQDSIRNEASNASVSSVSAEVSSSDAWINSTIRFDVTGIVSRNGSLLNANCSWIRFKVPTDLRVGNLSYNTIGAAYIKPAFEKYASFDRAPLNETIQEVAYEFGTEAVAPADAIQRAESMVMLDFSYLVPPIEQWSMTYNLTQGWTRWTYNPVPVAEAKMTVNPRQSPSFAVSAIYAYNATLSADGLAQVRADTITMDVSAGFEPLVMLAAVIVTFVVAVAASWTYRSRRKQLPRRRK